MASPRRKRSDQRPKECVAYTLGAIRSPSLRCGKGLAHRLENVPNNRLAAIQMRAQRDQVHSWLLDRPNLRILERVFLPRFLRRQHWLHWLIGYAFFSINWATLSRTSRLRTIGVSPDLTHPTKPSQRASLRFDFPR